VQHQVVRAGQGDVPELVSMLVRTFYDDPVATFMFCRDNKRERALGRFFKTLIRGDYLKTGEVWTTSEKSGAAVWGPPSKPRPGLKELFQMMPLLQELMPPKHLREAMKELFAVESERPKIPHWYLATLGTDPASQGHGVGSALMTSMLETIDAQHEPAYLESSKERNVPFYRRFGFEVTKELKAVPTGPLIWLMWREER
jgi:ribosomal protein S18 acetylase RimI-like enzyme